jgi:aspartate kinase
MRSHPGVAAKMFSALSNENINIIMISTSEIRVSCIIEEKYGELAVRVLHKVFNMNEAKKNSALKGNDESI